jgi:hypothetical protein
VGDSEEEALKDEKAGEGTDGAGGDYETNDGRDGTDGKHALWENTLRVSIEGRQIEEKAHLEAVELAESAGDKR